MITAMTTALTFLILIAPFAVAFAVSWAAGRSRPGLDQFWLATLITGRAYGSDPVDDRDTPRLEHDLDAVRTRFEQQPAWPASGALGERR